MKLKDKIKSYSFWVSIASAIILILKVLGGRFGFVVDESMVSDIFTAVCSILVLLGIIVVPSGQSNQPQTNKNLSDLNNVLNNSNEINSNYFDKKPSENINTEDDKTNSSLNENIDISSNTTSIENLDINKSAIADTSNTEDDKIQTTNINNRMDYAEKIDNEGEISLNEDTSFDSLINTVKPDDVFNDEPSLVNEVLDSTTLNNQSLQDDNKNNLFIECNPENLNTEIKTKAEDDNQNKISAKNQQNETPIIEESLADENHLSTENNFANTNVEFFKNLLKNERQKFSGDINKYIFELQEEIRRTREKM